jgi:Ca2+-dependent lipid-binding protein
LSKIEFLPASEGVLVVTAYEGRNLKNMELIGKQDPYCKYTIGKKLKRRTRTVNKGGTNPFFNEEEVEFWIGKNDWGHPCVFSCLDEDVGSDDLIGGRRFSLLPFFTQTEPTHDWFEISNKGKPAGEVQLRFEFFPAGRLKIQCHAGRNLGKLILHMTCIFVHDYFRPVLFFERLLIFDHYY